MTAFLNQALPAQWKAPEPPRGFWSLPLVRKMRAFLNQALPEPGPSCPVEGSRTPVGVPQWRSPADERGGGETHLTRGVGGGEGGQHDADQPAPRRPDEQRGDEDPRRHRQPVRPARQEEVGDGEHAQRQRVVGACPANQRGWGKSRKLS